MTTIRLPEDLKEELRLLAKELSTSEEEVVRMALREKILAVKQEMFRDVSDRVRQGLIRREVKPEELLEGLTS